MQGQHNADAKVSAKALTAQPCVYCAAPALRVSLTYAHQVAIARVACDTCQHEVAVAIKDGAWLVKCPKCGGVATYAYGKREGAPFIGLSCDRCHWLASGAFLQVAAWAFALLSD